MKHLFLAVIATGIIFATGCKKEKLIYSCNPNVNEWTINNKEKLSNINRSDLIKFDITYQKAIYRTLSPKKRHEIWKDKFVELMNIAKWNVEEKEHLTNLINSLNDGWFYGIDDSDPNILKQKNLFFKNWINYSMKKFHWDRSFLFSILVSLDNPVKNGRLSSVNYNNRAVGGGGGLHDCSCSTEDDWCDGFFGPDLGDCDAGNCDASDLGCGTLWTYPCNGECVLHGLGGLRK